VLIPFAGQALHGSLSCANATLEDIVETLREFRDSPGGAVTLLAGEGRGVLWDVVEGRYSFIGYNAMVALQAFVLETLARYPEVGRVGACQAFHVCVCGVMRLLAGNRVTRSVSCCGGVPLVESRTGRFIFCVCLVAEGDARESVGVGSPAIPGLR
jgi:hypothetical protein